jgi:hypothetical protein
MGKKIEADSAVPLRLARQAAPSLKSYGGQAAKSKS